MKISHDVLDFMAFVTMLVLIAAGLRILFGGYLVKMTGGTMNNSNGTVNVQIEKVENFHGNGKTP